MTAKTTHEILDALCSAIRESECRAEIVRAERAESSANYWRELALKMRADENERRKSAAKYDKKTSDCARISDADLRKKIDAYETARLRRGERAVPHKDEQIARELWVRRRADEKA